jgi:predicted metalloprotease with PDZ domain
MNRLAVVIVMLLAPPALLAQGAVRAPDSVSAPIRDVRYELRFMRANAEQRAVDVTMSFATTTAAPVILSLPAWTPGAYEMSNYSRWVLKFTALGDGRAIAWDKLDYDTWRIRPAGAKTVNVSFHYVADTLDNGIAWSKPDFLLLNGTNVFMYPEGQPLEYASSVLIHTSPTGAFATGMARAPMAPSRTYSAANYHDLVDMPFFVGKFDIDSARVAEKWVRFATYPAGSISGAVRQTAWDQIKRVIPPQIAVFGETPWENYTVMQIVDSAYGGASGLEHQNSHVDIFAPCVRGQRIPAVALRARDLSLVERQASPAVGDVAISVFSSAANARGSGSRKDSPTTTPTSRGSRRCRR